PPLSPPFPSTTLFRSPRPLSLVPIRHPLQVLLCAGERLAQRGLALLDGERRAVHDVYGRERPRQTEPVPGPDPPGRGGARTGRRSEEHTSELQSPDHL